MRLLIPMIAMLIISSNSFSQIRKQNTDSKIEKVTVFLKGAQVQRSAKASITPGKTDLVFGSISPRIDKQSIQVKADGKLTVLSVTHQMNILKEQEVQDEIKQIETQKQSLIDKMDQEKNMLNVYEQEEVMLLKNQNIKGDQALLKAADLKEAMDFQRQRLIEVYSKKTEFKKTINKLQSDIDKLNRQLIVLNQKKDLSTSEIIVSVSTKEATSTNFVLTYLVNSAGWYPTYDIRVKDINSPIDLQTKANVFQSSGEDWKEVKLTLSTGDPAENNIKPDLSPWHLRYVTYDTQYKSAAGLAAQASSSTTVSGVIKDEKGNPVQYATVQVKGTSVGTSANQDGVFSILTASGYSTIVVNAVGMEPQEITIPRGGFQNIVLKQNTGRLDEVVVVGYGTERSQSISRKERLKEQNFVETTISYQPTTTIYDIAEPFSVPNDGKTYTVDIDSYEVKALYEYYAAPKIEAEAFLTAKVVDWQDLNLLPGEANLFFEGTYLGKTLMDLKNAGDTLNLSLGNDKGVIVKRTLVKENSQKKFLASNKIDTRQYEIIVRNNKQQPINIIIEDQLPISTTKEIEIDNKEYPGAKLDDQTQKLTWQPKLEPKGETKLNFKYSVKYPKERVVNLD
jgi:uncharacterized protein DUF4139/uncharacterized protein DUF4140